MKLENRRINDDLFEKERKEVLSMWHTGGEVDLDEAIEYQKGLIPMKNYAKKLVHAKENEITLIRSDSGVPSVEEHCEYLRFLQEDGTSDGLGTIIDSLTRNLQFGETEKRLKESLETGKWVLNGFPLVAHGVANTRKILDAVDLPVMIRGVAPDWRLIAEIGLAGGHTATSGSPMIAFSQFSKNIPLETVLKNYQYMYRLIGTYEERGVPLVAGISGGFGIICPFSVIISSAVLDSLVAAGQGVKNISLTLNTQGNIIQDVAAIDMIRKLTEQYLERSGYQDVTVTLNCTNWSGKFPEDVFEASAVISLGVIAAVLAKGEIAHVKTIEEAKSIPKREANAASLRIGKTIIRMLENQELKIDKEALEAEKTVQEREARAIIDKVLEIGDGDAAIGEVQAVEYGMLDFPFATSRFLECRIKGVRDAQGCVRYLDHGSLPFDKEIIRFNKEKVAERGQRQGRKVDYQSVIEDLSSISAGQLFGSPSL